MKKKINGMYMLLSWQFHVGQVHRGVTVHNVETAMPGPHTDSSVRLSVVHCGAMAVETLAQGPRPNNRQSQDVTWALSIVGTRAFLVLCLITSINTSPYGPRGWATWYGEKKPRVNEGPSKCALLTWARSYQGPNTSDIWALQVFPLGTSTDY